jgi:hypothetical protein
MGYYIVRHRQFTALLGNGGYFIVNPERWNYINEKIEPRLDYSLIDKNIGKYFSEGMSISVQRYMYRNMVNYPSSFIGLALAKQKYPEMVSHEKSIYDEAMQIITEQDCSFYLSPEDMGDLANSIGSILSIFFTDSRLYSFDFDIGGNGFRIILKPQGLAGFFASKNSGQTLLIQSIGEISKVKLTPDLIEISLKSRKRLFISRDGPYFENK